MPAEQHDSSDKGWINEIPIEEFEDMEDEFFDIPGLKFPSEDQ